MKRREFLDRLMNNLSTLTPEDRNQVEEYYNELLDDALEDGAEESDILGNFGSPEEIAKQILADHQQQAGKATPDKATTSAAGLTAEQETGHDRTNSPSATLPSPQEYTAYQPVHALFIEAEDASISVIPSNRPTPKIIFTGYNPQMDVVDCSETNGVLRFSQRCRRTLFSFHWFRPQRQILVELPASFDGDIHVQSTNDSIEAQDLSALKSLHCSTTNARITALNIQATKVELASRNGGVRLKEIVADEIDARTTNAAVKAERCHSEQQMSLKSCNGAVQAESCNCQKVSLSSTNGTVRAEKLSGSVIHMETKNAAVRAEDIAGSEIRLETKNGAIRAVVRGDEKEYDVDTRTTNGNCNIRNCERPAATKRLYAHTTNGTIHVVFQK